MSAPVPSTPNLEVSDKQAAGLQKTVNRVTLDSMKAKVKSVEYLYPQAIPHMCICVVVVENGFALTGQSAPADPLNYDATYGQQLAFEDAIRKMWPLEAYLLRQTMKPS